MQTKSRGSSYNVPLSSLRRIEILRDQALTYHQANVGKLCELLCISIGLDEHFRALLRMAAELHDIGKLAISDTILNKPAPLDAGEVALMRTHSQIGHDILIEAGDPVLDFASTVALGHHERYDGSGYPRGLSGDAIPLGCRLVALCDVYDALRADRPYRPGVTHEAALSILTAAKGRASRDNFDPALLGCLLRCGDKITRIYADVDNRSSAAHPAARPDDEFAGRKTSTPRDIERGYTRPSIANSFVAERPNEAVPDPVTGA